MITVFVSSDGTSISAGSDSMREIEQHLRKCCGAIYLVSSASIRRPWVNFELGAIWARNFLRKSGQPEIPRIPLCHSGQSLSDLPPPLGMLQAKLAGNAAHLKDTFTTLEQKIGRKPQLTTDFDTLAAQISTFERWYSQDRHFQELISLAGTDLDALRQIASEQAGSVDFGIECIVESHEVGQMTDVLKKLEGIVRSRKEGQKSMAAITANGSVHRSGIAFVLHIPRHLVTNRAT